MSYIHSYSSNNVNNNRSNKNEKDDDQIKKARNQPKNNRFEKLVGDRQAPPTKKELEEMKGEKTTDESTPSSLFDLSKKAQQKPKKENTSSLNTENALAKPKEESSKIKQEASQGEISHESENLESDENGLALNEEISQNVLATDDPLKRKAMVGEQNQNSSGEQSDEQSIIKQVVDQQKTSDEHVANQVIQQRNAVSDISKDTKITKKESSSKVNSSFNGEENSEKAKMGVGINSPVQSVHMGSDKLANIETQNSRASAIQELVNRLVEAVQTVQRSDRMETSVILRNPPFEGVSVTLTSFDHAKGEFNVAFANLTQEAKVFLDEQLNRFSLSDNLAKKGIIIHIVTTTTEPAAIRTESGQASKDQNSQQDSQQEQRQNRERQNDREDQKN